MRLFPLLLITILLVPVLPLTAEIVERPPGTDPLGQLGLEACGVGRPRLGRTPLCCRVIDPWRLPFAVCPGERVYVQAIKPGYLRISRDATPADWALPPDSVSDPLASLRHWRILIAADESLRVEPLRDPLPDGWHDTGIRGSRDECMARIDARLRNTPDLRHRDRHEEVPEPDPWLFAR